eukprot:761161-Hanusia_phi.AAC.7
MITKNSRGNPRGSECRGGGSWSRGGGRDRWGYRRKREFLAVPGRGSPVLENLQGNPEVLINLSWVGGATGAVEGGIRLMGGIAGTPGHVGGSGAQGDRTWRQSMRVHNSNMVAIERPV